MRLVKLTSRDLRGDGAVYINAERILYFYDRAPEQAPIGDVRLIFTELESGREELGVYETLEEVYDLLTEDPASPQRVSGRPPQAETE